MSAVRIAAPRGTLLLRRTAGAQGYTKSVLEQLGTDDLSERLRRNYGVEVRALVRGEPMKALFGAEMKRAASVSKRGAPLRAEWAERFDVLVPPAGFDGALVELGEKIAKELGVEHVEPIPFATPPWSPTYRPKQGYLDAAPGGIGLAAAGPLSPSKVEPVRVVDVELSWCLDHEAYATLAQPALLGGELYADVNYRSHGTAVLGLIGGREPSSGVQGILPACELHVVSHWQQGISSVFEAIRDAAPYLGEGDVLLLEAQIAGPYGADIPVEWTETVYAAIKELTDRGAVVVEAAGNGGVDLGGGAYGGRFDRKVRDSGAILVGAGAASNGSGTPRSRLAFSNFGEIVDVQGWGEGVVTSGYGDLSRGGAPEERWYTATFTGTSSASAIVAGAAAYLQQARRSAGKDPISASDLRSLMRGAGPCAPEWIGPLPDLAELTAKALSCP